MQCGNLAKDLQIETLDAISRVIGPAETRELLQSLVGSLNSGFAEMASARQTGDFAALARGAHRLAGGCGSLGAMHLQEALRRIERASLAKDDARCDADMAVLPMLADKLGAAVANYSAADVMAD